MDLKKQYVELLSEIGFLEEDIGRMKRPKGEHAKGDLVRHMTGDEWNTNSHNLTVIKAVLCCGLYPSVVQIRSPQQKYKQVIPGTVAQPHQPKDLKFFTKDDGIYRTQYHTTPYHTSPHLTTSHHTTTTEHTRT